ncbi:MAG: hypothetical protein ABSC88_05260 [Terracidiphilus sp.]
MPEVIVVNHSPTAVHNGAARPKEGRGPAWFNLLALLIWLSAGVVVFLPFALDTSPLDAVMLRVPGNQGNWWHFLAGAPCFLAFPMIWLRLRALLSTQLSTPIGRRLLWSAACLSIAGTIAVETPFLLHLAGTSEWQRLSVLGLGFGIMIASAVILFMRRSYIAPTRACLAGLNTAYLANAALALVVYSDAPGKIETRSGWPVLMVIFWPILFELIWIYIQSFRKPAS